MGIVLISIILFKEENHLYCVLIMIALEHLDMT